MFRIGAILATFLIAGSALAHGFGGSTTPLPDNVVIFGEKNVQIAQSTNIPGGDTASNKRAHIGRDSFIEGSLLTNRAHIAQGVTILGNLEADRIKGNNFTVQGETMTPRVLPNYELPTIPNSTPGTERIRVRNNETATLQPGSYGAVSIGKNANVTLEPGTYDIRRLHIGRNTTLTVTGTTTLNISNNLFIGAGTIIDLAHGLDVGDLAFNVRSHGTVFVGKSVFGAGNIVAPNAKIHISKETTWRGRLVGKRVRVGKGSIVSAGVAFVRPSNPEKIVNDEGDIFAVDEVGVLFVDDVTDNQVEQVRQLISGRVVGSVPVPPMRLFEIEADAVADTDAAIATIENAALPFVEVVFRNSVAALIQ